MWTAGWNESGRWQCGGVGAGLSPRAGVPWPFPLLAPSRATESGQAGEGPLFYCRLRLVQCVCRDGGKKKQSLPSSAPHFPGAPRTALCPATPPAPRRRALFLLPRPCPTPGWLGGTPRPPPAQISTCHAAPLWRPLGSVLVPDVPDDGLSAKLHPQWPRQGGGWAESGAAWEGLGRGCPHTPAGLTRAAGEGRWPGGSGGDTGLFLLLAHPQGTHCTVHRPKGPCPVRTQME